MSPVALLASIALSLSCSAGTVRLSKNRDPVSISLPRTSRVSPTFCAPSPRRLDRLTPYCPQLYAPIRPLLPSDVLGLGVACSNLHSFSSCLPELADRILLGCHKLPCGEWHSLGPRPSLLDLGWRGFMPPGAFLPSLCPRALHYR